MPAEVCLHRDLLLSGPPSTYATRQRSVLCTGCRLVTFCKQQHKNKARLRSRSHTKRAANCWVPRSLLSFHRRRYQRGAK